LTAGGTLSTGCLNMIVEHALAAGRADLCARAAIDAARAALRIHAPDEVLRLVDLAQPVASTAADRVALILLRDDALELLRRPNQRFEGLAELAALAEAMGDESLELEVLLRRAAAFRLSKDNEQAAALARRVRLLAEERKDAKSELAACLELGQDLLRVEL